jgi:hypothetical protein
MIAGDKDTCDKIFAGINDTSKQLSLVLLSPAITFFPSVVDTSQKYSKSLSFIVGVNDIAEKLFRGVNNTAVITSF